MNDFLNKIGFPDEFDISKKEDLLKFFYEINRNGFRKFYKNESKFEKIFSKLYLEFKTWTFPDDWTFSQKIYHFLHDDIEFKMGKCKECGKQLKWICFNLGYDRIFCSRKCRSNNIEVKQKYKDTCLERMGVDHNFKSKECRDKIEQTNLIKFGKKSFSQTDEWKEKTEQTNLIKFGKKSFSQTDEFIIKTKLTNNNRYNSDYYSQTKEFIKRYKRTCNNRYHVDNFSQSDEFEKICLERYGVRRYAQSINFIKNHRKRIKYDNLTFDSSWEVDVYKYCKENNIPCEYQPNIQFTYEYNNKTFIYQPDFLINNKLYEIKGDQFFRDGKMINPYDRTQDEKYESKHQCMIENNVIILRGKDIKNLEKVIF